MNRLKLVIMILGIFTSIFLPHAEVFGDIIFDDGFEDCVVDPLGLPDVPDDLFQDKNCDGIDGTASNGIFVAEDGSDTSLGTQEFPVKTITYAITKAEAEAKKFVYIAAGTYTETVTLVAGIGLHGGYLRSSNWRRNGSRAVIVGPSTGVLKASNIGTPTAVEYLRIESADATVPGSSSQAVVVVNSTGFVPRHLTIVGGSGAAGLQGTSAGQDGGGGGNGTVGLAGFEDDGYIYCSGNVVDPPLLYAGGMSCIDGSTRGGDGRRGCKTNGPNCAGNNGDSGSGPSGGIGGLGVAGGPGTVGIPGGAGGPGTNGTAGSGGVISGNQWVPQAGGKGGRGFDGSGGGGGAGGGSTHSFGACNDWGGGGGGGGGGGCGGTGGDGGSGGGASIGMLLIDSSIANAVYVDVETKNGGAGGSGRGAGNAGPGGLGGPGGSGHDEGLNGGNGGNGGAGGHGGHGGGGAGGWSVCIYRQNSTYSNNGTGTLTPGAFGLGGSSSGNNGVNGTSQGIY